MSEVRDDQSVTTSAGMSRSVLLERIIVVSLLVAAGGVGVWALRPAPAPAQPKLEQPEIVVAVNGEVVRPGVYSLPFGSRVYAAIKAAGGFSPQADADLVNPAKRLEDGDQVRVPARPAETVVVTVATNVQPSPSMPSANVAEKPALGASAQIKPDVSQSAASKPNSKSDSSKPTSGASSATRAFKSDAKSATTPSGQASSSTPSSANAPKPNNRLLFALPKPPPPAPRVIVSRPTVTSSAPSSTPSSMPLGNPSSTTSGATRPSSGAGGTSASSDTGWGFNMNTNQPSPPAAPDPAEILARGININTASQAEIEALPGIGPTLAARIIEARPFTNPADLDRVKGIGPKMIEKITPYLRF